MGKKGVILDNGKAAQSSMALYWKTAQKKKQQKDKPQAQPKEENMEQRAQGGAAKWKLHKEKMIAKIYSKPQKEAQKGQAEQRQEQERAEQRLEEELLEKELNKNKPISIPGFKGKSELQKKMQFEEVKRGKEENNQLVFPEGQEALNQEEIIQLLRERKAKREFQKQRNNKKHEREEKVVEQDFLDLEPSKPQQPKKEEPEPQREPIMEEKSIFKSDILKQVQKGLWGKKDQKVEQKEEKNLTGEPVEQTEAPKVQSKFIPRALRQS